MPRLIAKETGANLGAITDADVKVLVDQLEEESMGDVDYFIDKETVDILEEGGASSGMIAMLRAAIGDGAGLEIRWEK